MNTPDPLLWNLLLLLLSAALLSLPFWPAWQEWRDPQDADAAAADTAAAIPPPETAPLQLAPGATFQSLHARRLLLGCGPMPAPAALPPLQRWQPPPGARPWGVQGWHIGHHLDIPADQLVPCSLVVRGRLCTRGPGRIEGDLDPLALLLDALLAFHLRQIVVVDVVGHLPSRTAAGVLIAPQAGERVLDIEVAPIVDVAGLAV